MLEVMRRQEKKTYAYPTAFSVWGNEEYDAIRRVINSGQFTIGEEVEAFEHEFASYHGMNHGIMVNSGSSANLIAAAALANKEDRPIRRGQRAAVPALAWPTTYAPLRQYGLDLVLMDCDDTWTATIPKMFDIQLVVGVSILGNPAYLAAMKEFARTRSAYFIEDNCESLGAKTPDGKFCGTYGLMNSFSFFYSHQISAIEGGMILTDDSECAKLCRMLRNHGWSKDTATCFDNEYDFRLFGYNVRPLEMHAAVARVQLRKLDEHRKVRQANVKLFREMTKELPIKHQLLVGEPDPFGLSFIVPTTNLRKRLANALREFGIDCRPPTGGSFRKHPYGFKWWNQRTPNADHIHDCGMFLGNGAVDLSDKIERAVKVMKENL